MDNIVLNIILSGKHLIVIRLPPLENWVYINSLSVLRELWITILIPLILFLLSLSRIELLLNISEC